MLENRGPLRSAFLSKVGGESTLVCYGNKPYLYIGVPYQAKKPFFEMFGAATPAAKPA